MTELVMMRDHWYRRPGWRAGRRMYTWHVTFADQPVMRSVVEAYQAVLGGLPGLVMVPFEWTHLTVQGLGFTDEVDRADVDKLVELVQGGLAGVAPFGVSLGPVVVGAEAVVLPVSPMGGLSVVRSVIRSAIGSVFGAVTEPEEWRAHVSVAYSTGTGSAERFTGPLRETRIDPVDVELGRIDLLALEQTDHLYRWDVAATAPFGARTGW